jgi:predicted GNAT family acetyltransferase
MTSLHDNTARSRYELEEQGHVAYADYRREGGRLYIDYVFSPPPLRGQGTAGRLMSAIGETARAQGLKITPICGYAGAWLAASKAYGDLVG